MAGESLDTTNKLLKVIIGLLLRPKSDMALTLKEQIEILDRLGLRPIEIAEVLGKTNTHVTKELAGIRKKRK